MAYPSQLQLITDRTAQDVEQRNNKGTYNAADLNRVETAAAYLSSMLQQLPITLKEYRELYKVADSDIFDMPYQVEDIIISTKNDWNGYDIPRPSAMSRYLNNVKTLCESLDFAHVTLPASMSNLTAKRANAIEQALLQLYDAILAFETLIKKRADSAYESFYYSGELYGGEV